jgi:hypothetical protein
METDDLIRELASDTRQRSISLSSTWRAAAGAATILAATIVLASLGPRPDLAAAMETPRLIFKFLVMITLAITAFGVLFALSRPGANWRKAVPLLAVAPCVLAAGVVIELAVLPPDMWWTSLLGAHGLACLGLITLIGFGPLTIFLLALRHGASARPTLAGGMAGLAAGGVAATLYALHCMDDSPLFVAFWYTSAIIGLGLVGAGWGRRLISW